MDFQDLSCVFGIFLLFESHLENISSQSPEMMSFPQLAAP